MRTWGILLAVVAALGVFMWAVDYITLEGEWTIYTVQCQAGKWIEDRCTGEVRAGNRYRFRALKNRNEVVFWIAGVNEPSGKLTPCAVHNRANWKCLPNADAERSITLEMRKGRAVPKTLTDNPTIHAVPKWQWFLLRYGKGS